MMRNLASSGLLLLWAMLAAPAYACMCDCKEALRSRTAESILQGVDYAATGVVAYVHDEPEPPGAASQNLDGSPPFMWRAFTIKPGEVKKGSISASTYFWAPTAMVCGHSFEIGDEVKLLARIENGRATVLDPICRCEQSVVFPDTNNSGLIWIGVFTVALAGGVVILALVTRRRNSPAGET